MKFYLNNELKEVEISPVITRAKDGTLPSASVVLKANTDKEPYAPMQEFRIETENENNDIYYYIVGSDSVSVFSNDPLTYKHSLSLIDKKKKTNKHIVRNSSFSQPAKRFKSSYLAMYETLIVGTQQDRRILGHNAQSGNSDAVIPLHIDSKDKVKSSFLKISVQYCCTRSNPLNTGHIFPANTLEEMNSKIDSSLKSADMGLSQLYLYYTLNGQQESVALTINANDIIFGKPFELPIIKEKIELGANDLYIGTYYSNVFGYTIPFGSGVSFTPPTSPTQNKWIPIIIMIQIEAVIEYYYHSAYDILNLLIKRQRQKTQLYQKVDLFNLPLSTDTGKKKELYDLLTSTVAPNFTFTQSTMLECVSEVFRLFDAYFTLDSTNCLEINYLNESNESIINGKYSSAVTSISEERFNNGIITYFQGAKPTVRFPNNNALIRARSSNLGVPAQDDHNFIVDKPIDYINKLEVKVTQFSINNVSIKYDPTLYPDLGDIPLMLDLSNYVVEEGVWSVLSTTGDLPYNHNYLNLVQNNTLSYSKGSNIIPLAKWGTTTIASQQYYFIDLAIKSALHRLSGVYLDTWDSQPTAIGNIRPFTSGEENWNDFMFRAEYISTIDGRVKIESISNKYDGEMLIDQSNGSIDLNKMGLNMLGTSLMMGEPTRNYTHEISNMEDRIKEGQYFIENGERWVANSCSYTIINMNKIVGQISFVKNFNALSQRINLLQEKRMSNISSELTLKSEDNYIEYVYYSSVPVLYSSFQNIAYRREWLYKSILSTFKSDYEYYTSPDYAMFRANVTNTTGSGTKTTSYIYLPMVKYGAGNSICFEMSFDSPISAGNRTTATSGWFGSVNYYTDSIKYTDENGILDQCTIYMFQETPNQVYSSDFPFITEDDPEEAGEFIYALRNYEIYKQPNEVFALNYELCFLPIESRKQIDFLGNAFINDNAFVNPQNLMNHRFYLYYTNSVEQPTFKYSVLDTKGEGLYLVISSVEFLYDTNNNIVGIKFNHLQTYTTAITWAICDENRNIYFASNESQNAGTTKVIYFTPRHNRL